MAVCAGFLFVSCSDDDLDPVSIFVDGTGTSADELDPYSPTYQLDKWADDNFRKTYNLQFKYKMEDVATDMSYNLVPAEYDKSVNIAVLTKYLWFDAYYTVVEDKDFMKKYGPRIIHLIGSPAVNAANGTITLGLAEAGIKISLFNLNSMDVSDFRYLNEYYFLTMHHEFAHVLHQTKTYPKVFDTLSAGNYDALGWQYRNEKVTASLGFVSPYGSSQPREDFAETIAHYITDTDEDWNELLDWAAKGWDTNSGKELASDTDGVDGKALILQKVDIARQWLRDSWQIDLDALRDEVQRRQNAYSEELLEELKQDVYSIPTGSYGKNEQEGSDAPTASDAK